MRLGPYTLDNNLLLAPMAGVTDKPFRQLCRMHGAGLTVSEMVASDPALWNTRKSQLRSNHYEEETPRSVQIVGADPEMMANAAKHNADLGAQIVDINMGCPARKVCNVFSGSALMQDEKLVTKILESVVDAVDIPVTLKIRTGWNEQNKNAVKIAQIAENSGIQMLTVHGRTRACGFRGEAEYQTIKQVKDHVSIPVIANGDITTSEKAADVLRATGADGIMLGRVALGNPWIFNATRPNMMQDEKLVTKILESVVDAVDIPVTLKIRTGWNEQNKNAVKIAQIAENSGIQMLTVHGRTRACGFRGEAEYQTIKQVKDHVSIPVIANGDITTSEKAADVLRATGADGIMLGRVALGNPWIFNEISHYLKTGVRLPRPTIDEIRQVVLQHLNGLYELYGEYTGVRVARKHVGWYSKYLENGGILRSRVNKTESIERQLLAVKNYFNVINNGEVLVA